MEKFQKVAEKWIEARKELRKECEDFLKHILKANNNRIEWESDEEMVCVTYDGGSHPEYASNAFSMVSSVYTGKDGKILLDTEDDSEYNLDNVPTHEVYGLCDFIDKNVLPEDKED